jgi:diguanylate cyclase
MNLDRMSGRDRGLLAVRVADINIAQSRGDAVMSLLARAEIAPLPLFYRLLYDYVAGVQSLDAGRFGSMVDRPDSREVSNDRLYDDFIRPYETTEALGEVVDKMVRRLKTLDAAIVERREAASAQSAELSAAYKDLAEDAVDRRLMFEWVARLAAANNAARAANSQLTQAAEQARSDLIAARDELSRLSRDSLVDPLTSVANRKGLDGALSAALTDARDNGVGLAVAVVDVDRFKQFNDDYGHQVGDAVLKLVTRALLASLRSDDLVGRMGGDEFVAVLRNCSLEAATRLAETVRRAVMSCDLAPILGADILGCVTVSIGIASYRSEDTIVSLLDRADRYLLEAKGSGRNRVLSQPADAARSA